ncbi:biotin-dependent carboxyltransferase family protein [Candidatus Fermentibacteria bacterium]|nr:biotin-dependent carboxyltransferase family protein [Candidatus Fermentibacteria bacterium]
MRTIEVIKGGAFSTVQDMGRYGYQRYGVPVSGALDQFALRVGNLLVGNEEGDAGVETTFMGPTLKFHFSATIAITGGDLSPVLDGQRIPGWTTVSVPEGSTLSFKGPKDGIRSYVCVRGGIDVPIVMGSRSTFTRSQIGGFHGRALTTGDMVPVADPDSDTLQPAERSLASQDIPRYNRHHTLHVTMGPQDDAFTAAGIDTFLASTFTVTPMFDRMGYRLDGPVIQHKKGADIVSDGTSRGAVQVPGSGKPIVLLADCGTTGGYTKIATVISTDLPKIAQAQPEDTVAFRAVSLEEAHRALGEQEAVIASLRG